MERSTMLSMGKSTINGSFSIAMLVYQRVSDIYLEFFNSHVTVTTRGYHPTIPTLAKLCTAIPHGTFSRLPWCASAAHCRGPPPAEHHRPPQPGLEKWQPPDPGSNQKIVVVIFEVFPEYLWIFDFFFWSQKVRVFCWSFPRISW